MIGGITTEANTAFGTSDACEIDERVHLELTAMFGGYAENAEGETENKTYTVTYYPYHYFSNGWESLTPMRQNAAYTEQEQRYYDFVKETYLTIPSTLKQTLLDLAAENDIVANSSTVISDVVYYIRNAAMYDYFYADKNYPNDKDMVTHFLTGIRRGVCRHFAAAATMMFRALGIPARYTIGFAVDVEANVKLEYSGAGHAWTEIYLQGYGWIPLEVTGGNLYTGEA
jgi:transglutaminase-like putative cysteine protease